MLSVQTLAGVPLLGRALAVQQQAIRAAWSEADAVLGDQAGIAPAFRVTLGALPAELLDLERNLFSTFFVAALQTLPVSPDRCRLYAVLNHLFRAWVTSADNLLDNEDKSVFHFRMSNDSRIMPQIVTIMMADRVLHSVLDQAVEAGVLSRPEARSLSVHTLRILLPSGAEEAMEEDGFEDWSDPAYILNELHPLKTGILFQVPFLGPELVETQLDAERVAEMKAAMTSFGIGCQVLDDIRDMARDFLLRRANYVVAVAAARDGAASVRQRLAAGSSCEDSRVYQSFPEAVESGLDVAFQRIDGGLARLDRCGMTGLVRAGPRIRGLLLRKLDLADLVR